MGTCAQKTRVSTSSIERQLRVMADDFSSHVILLGGIGWNKVAARFQRATSQVPIEQTAVDDLQGGDIFRVETSDGPQSFYPEYEDLGEGKELIADVGYLARLRNPFKHSRTLTICNGIHSRGVFGAVRCLTDARVREAEREDILRSGFPMASSPCCSGSRLWTNETLSPDLQDPSARLYEWSPNAGWWSVSGASLVHRSLKKVQQRASHAALSQDVSRVPAPPVRSRPWAPGRHHRAGIQAGVLPSAGHQLGGPARTSCSSSSAASRQGPSMWQSGCRLRQGRGRSSSRFQRTGATRSFLLEHPAKSFRKANAYRESDLSAKRNIGLLAGSLTWLEQDRLR